VKIIFSIVISFLTLLAYSQNIEEAKKLFKSGESEAALKVLKKCKKSDEVKILKSRVNYALGYYNFACEIFKNMNNQEAVLLYDSLCVGKPTTDTLYVSKLSDYEWTRNFSKSYFFNYIKFADGSVLSIGDALLIGQPSGTNQAVQVQQGLISSNVTLTNKFSFLMAGKMGLAVLAGINYLSQDFNGREAQISSIKIIKGNGLKSADVFLTLTHSKLNITVLNFSSAFQLGELINPKAAMKSDEALTELLRQKNKLELGLITEAEFDSIRAALSKFID
tara:strand:- start:136 stop:969 length:834 start_codon:yes stop_codon:yes gene_type:complete